jgi:DNA-binding NtrC family response regulator
MSKVLVVDDDDTIRETLWELLSEDNSCQTAETVEQALTLLNEDFYDLILTDLSMPGLSGVDLLRRVRETYPDTRVIIVSGMDDKDRAESLIQEGAFDVLFKPFTLDGVEQTVKRALDAQ